MRVALLIAAYHPRVGGAEKQARLLARRMRARHDVDFTVVTRGADGAPAIETLDGTRVVRIPSSDRNRWLASSAYLSAGLAVLALQPRRFDVYHCVQSYSPATLGALAARLRGGRLIVKVTASNLLGEAAELRRLPFFAARMRLFERVDEFVALTPQVERELVALGIEPRRIVQIPNGVEIAQPITADGKRELRRRLGLDADSPLAIYVGRLSEEKGLLTLLRAWAQVVRARPDARLALVGAGGLVRSVEAALVETVEELGLHGSVRFTGAVDDVGPYFNAADIFVLPSRTEGLSNALLEAMAHGKAIVTTDIDGNSFIAADRQCLKVAADDVEALSAAITTLVESAPLRDRLGLAARQLAIDELSIESVCDRYFALYRRGPS
ncbi:MAG TPA: glycosyltransferase family 4 protein [Polyangia bacterium]